MIARTLLTLLCLATLAGVVAGCASGESAEQVREAPADDAPPVEVPAYWATGLAHDVPTLTQNSDVVFVGTVTERTGQREEQLREGATPGGRGTFPITQYAVTVEREIAGDLPDSVVLEQAGGLTQGSGGPIAVRLEGDPQLIVGGRYLFFANWKDNGTLSAPPFGRLPIEDGRLAEPEAWRGLGAVEQLTGMRVSDAADEVQSAR